MQIEEKGDKSKKKKEEDGLEGSSSESENDSKSDAGIEGLEVSELAKYLIHREESLAEVSKKQNRERLAQIKAHVAKGSHFVVIVSKDPETRKFTSKKGVDEELRNLAIVGDSAVPDYLYIQNKGDASSGHWDINHGNKKISTGMSGNSCQSYSAIEIVRRSSFSLEVDGKAGKKTKKDKKTIINELINAKNSKGKGLFSKKEKKKLKDFFKEKSRVRNSSLSGSLVRKFQEAIFLYGRTEKSLDAQERHRLTKEIRRSGVQIEIGCIRPTLERIGILVAEAKTISELNQYVLMAAGDDEEEKDHSQKGCQQILNDPVLVDLSNHRKRELYKLLAKLSYSKEGGFFASNRSTAKKLAESELDLLKKYCTKQGLECNSLLKEAQNARKKYKKNFPEIGIKLMQSGRSKLLSPVFTIGKASGLSSYLKELNRDDNITVKKRKDGSYYCYPSGDWGSFSVCLTRILEKLGDNCQISVEDATKIHSYYKKNRMFINPDDKKWKVFDRGFEHFLTVANDGAGFTKLELLDPLPPKSESKYESSSSESDSDRSDSGDDSPSTSTSLISSKVFDAFNGTEYEEEAFDALHDNSDNEEELRTFRKQEENFVAKKKSINRELNSSLRASNPGEFAEFLNPSRRRYSGIGAKATIAYDGYNQQWVFTIQSVVSGGPADRMELGKGSESEIRVNISDLKDLKNPLDENNSLKHAVSYIRWYGVKKQGDHLVPDIVPEGKLSPYKTAIFERDRSSFLDKKYKLSKGKDVCRSSVPSFKSKSAESGYLSSSW